jgi:hypothetical protein
MAFTKPDPTILATARTFAEAANTRWNAGDKTIATDEGVAYLALLAELKNCGVASPFMAVLDLAIAPVNFRA